MAAAAPATRQPVALGSRSSSDRRRGVVPVPPPGKSMEPSSAGSTSAAASALRWRARLTREATAAPNDDSSLLSAEDGAEKPGRPPRHGEAGDAAGAGGGLGPRREAWLRAACLAAVGAAVGSLFATRTWLHAAAAALTAFNAGLLLRQRAALRGLGGIHSDEDDGDSRTWSARRRSAGGGGGGDDDAALAAYAALRRRLRAERHRSEQLYRRLARLEESREELRHRERLLLQVARGSHHHHHQPPSGGATDAAASHDPATPLPALDDPRAVATVVLDFAAARRDLMRLLETRVQATLLKALVRAHHPQSEAVSDPGPPPYRLAAPQLAGLLKRLRAVPGVTSVHEEALRDLLLWEPPAEPPARPPAARPPPPRTAHRVVPRLLRQVEADAALRLRDWNDDDDEGVDHGVDNDDGTPSASDAAAAPRLAFGTTPRGTHGFWTPYRSGVGSVATAARSASARRPGATAAVVFGVSLRAMMAAAPSSAARPSEATAAWDEDGYSEGGSLPEPSPRESLYSC